MKKKFSYLSLLFLLACSNNSKKDLLFRRTIAPMLYVETFRDFGSGALGGDLVTDYLTDSINFRHKGDTYDNAENRFKYTLNGDTVTVTKYILESPPKLKEIAKVKLSLKELKKEGNFKK